MFAQRPPSYSGHSGSLQEASAAVRAPVAPLLALAPQPVAHLPFAPLRLERRVRLAQQPAGVRRKACGVSGGMAQGLWGERGQAGGLWGEQGRPVIAPSPLSDVPQRLGEHLQVVCVQLPRLLCCLAAQV